MVMSFQWGIVSTNWNSFRLALMRITPCCFSSQTSQNRTATPRGCNRVLHMQHDVSLQGKKMLLFANIRPAGTKLGTSHCKERASSIHAFSQLRHCMQFHLCPLLLVHTSCPASHVEVMCRVHRMCVRCDMTFPRCERACVWFDVQLAGD